MRTHTFASRGLRGLAAAGLVAVATLTGAGAASAATPSDLSTFDRAYLPQSMMGVYFETQYAAMAREKATNDKVRAFGEMFLSEHGAIKGEVVALADKDGIALPTELPPPLMASITAIRSKSGAEFDRAWAEGSAMGHGQAIALTKQAVAKAGSPEVKAVAVHSLTVLERHYGHALALARELGTQIPTLVNTGEGLEEPAGSRTLPLAAALGLLVIGVGLAGRSALTLRRSRS